MVDNSSLRTMIRSAITGRADFCFWCGARAADARSQGEQQTELEPEPEPGPGA